MIQIVIVEFPIKKIPSKRRYNPRKKKKKLPVKIRVQSLLL